MKAPLLLSKDAKTELSPDLLHMNFLLFSTSFSLVHATVDGVLVYATAELGPLLGGVSGGLLYACYAGSSLFLAKNVLHQLKARSAVLFGMVCLLTYVSTFLMALAVPDVKWIVCVIGSITGGIGAGIMWTAQGSYYALNSSLYLLALCRGSSSTVDQGSNINSNSNTESNRSTILNKFAAYFAAIYLCSEAACKMLVTGLFLIFSGGHDDDDDSEGNIGSWQVIAFFAFTLVAWTATGCSFWILDLSAMKLHYETEMRRSSLPKDSSDGVPITHLSCESDTVYSESCSSSSEECGAKTPSTDVTTPSTLVASFVKDFSAVLYFIRDHQSFRYLLPYQFSFGVCSTFMGFLVYGVILNDNGKEGYIGLLSALSVLFAGGLAIPVATFTNFKSEKGNSMTNVYIVMLAGAAIFITCSIFPLLLSEETIATWPVILPLVCAYGAGRSIWENSNKALIANMFTADMDCDRDGSGISSFRLSMSSINECADEEKSPTESCHERAFAAIYFTSGVGAAIGFFIFKFLSSETIAALTGGVGCLALFSNHYFFTHCHNKKQQERLYIPQ
jgi:hypothetical protein